MQAWFSITSLLDILSLNYSPQNITRTMPHEQGSLVELFWRGTAVGKQTLCSPQHKHCPPPTIPLPSVWKLSWSESHFLFWWWFGDDGMCVQLLSYISRSWAVLEDKHNMGNILLTNVNMNEHHRKPPVQLTNIWKNSFRVSYLKDSLECWRWKKVLIHFPEDAFHYSTPGCLELTILLP